MTACFTTGCNDDETAPALKGVVLDVSDITVIKGQTAQLSFTVSPDDAQYTAVYWKSEDETVATVDQNGLVTGVKIGETSVSVTIDAFHADCRITVKGGPVEELILDRTALSLFTNGTAQLSCTYFPEDAEASELTWKSSDETIATVDETGLVTACNPGSAVVTAAMNNIEATCEVTVAAPAAVGDYFYADGTWSADLDPAKTCIGIVCYAGQHENDKSDYSATGIGSVKCHGYVVPLRDACEKDCAWGPQGPNLGNYPVDDEGKAIANANATDGPQTDWSGYLYTENIRNAAADAGGLSADKIEGYPATYHAVNFDVEAPATTSGWFLPAISQVYAMTQQNDRIVSAGGTAFKVKEWYVSSSEEGVTTPEDYAVYYTYAAVNPRYAFSSDGKDISCFAVRAMLAF